MLLPQPPRRVGVPLLLNLDDDVLKLPIKFVDLCWNALVPSAGDGAERPKALQLVRVVINKLGRHGHAALPLTTVGLAAAALVLRGGGLGAATAGPARQPRQLGQAAAARGG
jgi:hypothetical protein